MSLNTRFFNTGPATLPDVGLLQYNGCTFSPLFVSNVSGRAVEDNARRTVKCMEYTLKADGYVTLPDGAQTTDGAMNTLKTLLTQQGGALYYTGRGMDLIVNPPANRRAGFMDVAWGPVPEILDFQPLGAGRSAKIQWQVKVRVTRAQLAASEQTTINLAGLAVQLLQFNYDVTVGYDQSGFSRISMRGTMEIPMTRTPTQATRTLTRTVDDFRSVIETRVLSSIDLSRFIVSDREFAISRDRRTIEWFVKADEKPYMDLPPDCTVARGTYSVRPAKSGMGLATWLCTLRATYTVRADRARRLAWFAFLALVRRRMVESRHGNIPIEKGKQNPPRGALGVAVGAIPGAAGIAAGVGAAIGVWKATLKSQGKLGAGRKAFLVDFSFDEGLYLDSKSVSFSATWRLNTTFSHILLASGVWTKLPEKDARGNNYWATSVRDISGVESWLVNRVDPKLDVIVDFGGG